MTLLSNGTLSVARFDADGRGRHGCRWSSGRRPLTPEFGFKSQADVVIDARLAADLLGATRMDRPEDVQPNRSPASVYVMLTNNTNRKPDDVNAANPRADNAFGHIIEMTPPDGDHAADNVRLGHAGALRRPARRRGGRAVESGDLGNGWFACPTTLRSTVEGRLWVSTDQGDNWARPAGPTASMRSRPTARGARTVQAVLPLPGRRRDVRPLLHA